MKKRTVILAALVVLVLAIVILLFKRFPVEPSRLRWDVRKEQPRIIEKSKNENRLQSVLFLNEIYKNYQQFTCSTPTVTDRYEIDLSSTTIIQGKVKKRKDRLEVRGKNVVIGLERVGHLLRSKNLDVLTMIVTADRDIDIKVYETNREDLFQKGLLEYDPDNTDDSGTRFIFLGSIPASKRRERINIELRNYAVKQREHSRHLVLSISGSGEEDIKLLVHELSLKSHQARIIASFPSVHFFKTKEKWLKSLFIPGGSSVGYLIHADKPFFFQGCLGAFSGEAPIYEISANGKTLLSRPGSADLPHFSLTISPYEGKALVEISVRSQGKNAATGVLGNGTFFYRHEGAANIILYLVDALRSDYGGIERKERKKLFESHFADGAVFENAYANATWTGDSLPVIFSGKYKFTLVTQPQDHPNLPDEEHLLAEYLKTRGYTTAALITNSFLVKDNAGQGFDVVCLCWGKGRGLSLFPDEKEYRDFKYGGMERHLREITDQNRDRKLFLFIHTLEPHDPYELPESMRRYSRDKDRAVLQEVSGRFKERLTNPSPEQIAALKALYKDEVLAAYRFFSKTSRMLEKKRILNRNSLFLLTADHGERFFEHGSWLHAQPDVYNEVLRIPLMSKGPGFRAGRFRQNVQLADIYPTIMEWLGDRKRKDMVGHSLMELISEGTADNFKNRVIYADGARHPLLYSCIIGSLKIIVNGANTEVYDLNSDPGETKNLAAREEFAPLIQVARNFREKFKTGGRRKKQTLNEAELERLKSLGYLD